MKTTNQRIREQVKNLEKEWNRYIFSPDATCKPLEEQKQYTSNYLRKCEKEFNYLMNTRCPKDVQERMEGLIVAIKATLDTIVLQQKTQEQVTSMTTTTTTTWTTTTVTSPSYFASPQQQQEILEQSIQQKVKHLETVILEDPKIQQVSVERYAPDPRLIRQRSKAAASGTTPTASEAREHKKDATLGVASTASNT